MAPRERHDITGQDQQLSYESNGKTLDLAPEDQWIATVDLNKFREDLKELGKNLSDNQDDKDVSHLKKFILWSNLLTFTGVITMGWVPVYYILPALALSIGTTSRWTMIAHHTCHGGYDNCEKSGRFNRFKFAVGSLWRRFCDWFDWMHPEAWNVEHNNLHHYHLGEDGDPDLVERNMKNIRDAPIPMFLKYMVVGFFMATWKWTYYAPNTYKELRIKEFRKEDPKKLEKYMADPKWDLHGPYLIYTYFVPGALPPFLSGLELITRVLGPYLLYRFFIVPLPWLALGHFLTPEAPTTFYFNAMMTLFLADIFGNAHSFLIVAPNHAGYDLYKFSTHCKPRTGMFYLRQVISSANFSAGTDLVDFMHGFLNYQVEHHLWPDLSMKSYQKAMPEVKKICKKHNVPYIQQSVFLRLWRTVQIMVGSTEMRQFPEGIMSEEN